MDLGQVWKKSSVLVAAMLIMAAAWSLLRWPGSSLQMVTFAFLTATLLCNTSSFERRLLRCIQIGSAAAGVQFFISITADYPLIRVALSWILTFFILVSMPDKQSAVTGLIAGFLALTAEHTFRAAAARSVDIFLAALVVLVVTALSNLLVTELPEKTDSPCPLREAAVISAEVAVGFIIALLLKHPQSEWVMLTVLFIQLSASKTAPLPALVKRRIAATPLGIWCGGLYLAGVVNHNYRMIYIVPVTGTLSFFMLYLKNDYFIFTFLFMFTVTLFSDWMLGSFNRFHFAEIMFVRTLATAIGGIVLLCGEIFIKKEQKA